MISPILHVNMLLFLAALNMAITPFKMDWLIVGQRSDINCRSATPSLHLLEINRSLSFWNRLRKPLIGACGCMKKV